MIEIVNKSGIVNLNPCKNEEVLIENSSNVEGIVQPKSSRSRRNNK